MVEDRKAWKSTEDNPYYSIYGVENLPNGFQHPDKNVISLEDCAEYRAKWQNCLQQIDGPQNQRKKLLHNCNEFFSNYKLCIIAYKAVRNIAP
jgi:hypothetical protein